MHLQVIVAKGVAERHHLRAFAAHLFEPKESSEGRHRTAGSRGGTSSRDVGSASGSETHHDAQKPFAIEPPRPVDGAAFTVEVTTLSEEAEATLLREALLIREGAKSAPHFGKVDVRFVPPGLERVIHTSYPELLELACSEPTVCLAFREPTVFTSSKHGDTSFPIPELVFGHLRRHWNLYGSRQAPLNLSFPGLGLRVADFDLAEGRVVDQVTNKKTGRLVRREFVGFTGRVRFEARGPAADEPARRALHALAAYSDYCGVGANKRIGMGATRYLGP